jgi:eukaryotic-like serine/threonine-protein kinase
MSEPPASLVGQTVGHFRILEKIGAGGMGVVYRAHDDRLGRDVAIKVLPPSFSRDAARLRRFEQEARAAAALNHPNILAIYDIGTHEGAPYIVAELLEGESLQDRLRTGPMAVRPATDTALQVARGLAAAHEKGIVHRDLKPGNIFLTRDGRAKILDFGLAKLTRAEPASSAPDAVTLTSDSVTGAVLGTVGYMSPEQVRGFPVDHRSDLFSFGAILYEMLSGKRAFRRDTPADTMSAILTIDPPELSETERAIPLALERVVRHCLEKNPEERFQSARDLAFDLSSVIEGSASRIVPLAAMRVRRLKRHLPWAVAAAAAVLAVAAWVAGRSMGRPQQASYQRLTFQRGTVYGARFGASGRTVVYAGAWDGNPLHLYSVALDSTAAQALNLPEAGLLAVSRTGEMALAVKPDYGAHLEPANATLARVPPAGGAPREILEQVLWADWDAAGELAVVHRVEGKNRLEYPIGKVLYETPGWISHIRFSPSGDQIGFLEHPAVWDDRGSVCVTDLAGNVRTLSKGWQSEDGLGWSPDGKEIWFAGVAEGGYNRALMAVDLAGHTRTLLRVPGGITLEDVATDGRVLISFENERLSMEAVGPGMEEGRDLTWYDWTIAKDISHDRKRVLFEESSEPAGVNYAVCVRGFDGSPPVRLGDGSGGGLSPDDKWALSVFTGTPEHIALLPLGPGQPRMVTVPGIEHFENGGARFLPDGKALLIDAVEAGHARRTYVQDLEGGKPRPLTPEGVTADIVSPDGRLAAGRAAGHIEVYALDGGAPQTVPGLGAEFSPVQWSTESGWLYVYNDVALPAEVSRVNIATGKMEPVRKLIPRDPAGVVYISPIVMTPDAKLFAYSSYRMLSVLYVVSGLR